MATLPDLLALTSIADGGAVNAAPLRNDFASVQTAVNALIAALAGGSAGSILEATDSNDVDWNGGVYQAYTPTWGASGTAVSLGNGTIVGRYARVGKFVHAYGKLTMGSTTTFGTGTYSLGLPVAASTALPSVTGLNIGDVYGFHSSTTAFARATAIYASTATFNMQYPSTYPSGIQAIIAQTVPWTWASADVITFNIFYEAA